MFKMPILFPSNMSYTPYKIVRDGKANTTPGDSSNILK